MIQVTTIQEHCFVPSHEFAPCTDSDSPLTILTQLTLIAKVCCVLLMEGSINQHHNFGLCWTLSAVHWWEEAPGVRAVPGGGAGTASDEKWWSGPGSPAANGCSKSARW